MFTADSIKSASILATPVTLISFDELCARIAAAVDDTRTLEIGHQNLHGLHLAAHNPEMREFFNRANIVYADGRSLFVLGRLLGVPIRAEHCFTFLDNFDLFLAECERRGWRVFYLGSKSSVVSTAVSTIYKRFPDLSISIRHGYFDRETESEAVVEEINHWRPHIVLVGLGMPIQEKWLLEHGKSIQANAILTTGATLDYVVGENKRPPTWAGELGLFWLFRLLSDPKRLWKRYLIEPWSVALQVCRTLLQGKEY